MLWSREAAFGGEEDGGIGCMGGIPQRKLGRLSSKADMRRRLYGKPLTYYTISRAFINIWYHCIVQFSPPFIAKRKEEKTPSNTPHNPNSPVLTSLMQLPAVPLSPDGRLRC